MFWLKKSLSFWLMPLPLCLGLLVVGLLLVCSARRARLGRGLMAAAVVLLLLFSNNAVSNLLLRPLEAQYPAVPELAAGAAAPAALSSCRYIVVLGSGHADMPGLSATAQLSSAGLARVVEAVRLLRLLPDARMIVSGPGEPGHPTHADVLSLAARSLGVDPARITQIEDARDTEDESLAVARIAGRQRVALVTSAWHMPRAAFLFRRAGVDFLPCPADFGARDDPRLGWGSLAWDTGSLERSTSAVHEWIGLLWVRLRGRT